MSELIQIPRMTHELSRYWDQPSQDKILIDDKYAVMDQKTFDELGEYSCSVPTGTYTGKMWKLHVRKGDSWWLRWYGNENEDGTIDIHNRRILII